MKETTQRKMKRIFWANSLFIIIVTLISGCGSTQATIMPTLKQSASTATPGVRPTLTVQPTQTIAVQIIALTSTITFTPDPTTTPTLPSTLEAEQTRETIKAYLQDGGNCETPCFLGILPGTTTRSEAEDIFMHIGLPVRIITYQGQDFYNTHSDFDNGLSLSIVLTVQDEMVKNLRLYITPEKQQAGVIRDWSAYSPDTLIKRYGQPSRVDFFADWGPGPFFAMQMYFDTVDLIVQYSGSEIIPPQKGSSRVCPLAAQFETVWLWMGKNPVYPPGQGKSLQEVTSLTLDEFSELMNGDPQNACFTFKGDVFK